MLSFLVLAVTMILVWRRVGFLMKRDLRRVALMAMAIFEEAINQRPSQLGERYEPGTRPSLYRLLVPDPLRVPVRLQSPHAALAMTKMSDAAFSG